MAEVGAVAVHANSEQWMLRGSLILAFCSPGMVQSPRHAARCPQRSPSRCLLTSSQHHTHHTTHYCCEFGMFHLLQADEHEDEAELCLEPRFLDTLHHAVIRCESISSQTNKTVRVEFCSISMSSTSASSFDHCSSHSTSCQ